MAGLKLAFIDIDNTLLDFDAYVRETMLLGFEHFGLRKYEPWMYDRFTEINNGFWHKIESKEITFKELERDRWNAVFKGLDIDFDGPTFERYFRAHLNECAIPVEGAYEMLNSLYDKFVLAAASNGPFNQQVNRLKIAGMDKYFRYYCVSEKYGFSKPSKEFFEKAFEEINAEHPEIKPEETIIIGDSMTSDIAGGFNYGIKTCYYRRPGAKPADERCDFCVDNLKDIINVI